MRLDELLETPSHVYFVMDLYLGGNLADHVAIAPIPEALARGTSSGSWRRLRRTATRWACRTAT